MVAITKDGDRYFMCCMCHDIFNGWGNNPYPLTDNWLEEDSDAHDESECCNDCNTKEVLPARFRLMDTENETR